MQKYGIKNPEELLEDEITKFLQGEKLNDADLKRLDLKVKNLLRQKAANERLKTTLTQSLQDTGTQNHLTLDNVETNTQPRGLSQSKVVVSSTAPSNTLNQGALSPQLSKSGKRTNVRVYKKPEEELAELEAEFAEEEAKNKTKYERLDFTTEGNEWSAIAKYNRKLYEKEIEEERIRDEEMKRRNRADLDLQVKQKLKREYEDELKEKEYDKILAEHRKKMDELEREKQEKIQKQIMKEKEIREAQMKDNNVRRRLEVLKNKKFEKSLVKAIQEGIECEKKAAAEKKIKENQALNKAIADNEIKKKERLEKIKKEKEEDVKMTEENIKMELRKDNERKKYYDMIKAAGGKYITPEAEAIREKMKKLDEEEERKTQYYYEEKNRLAIEKERKEQEERRKQKLELRKYLDMQVEERKKEEDFLKSLDDEQARIWKLDCQRYNQHEKDVEKKIKEMNKRNLELLNEQVDYKKGKSNAMTDSEYAMNREILEKAKATLAK